MKGANQIELIKYFTEMKNSWKYSKIKRKIKKEDK